MIGLRFSSRILSRKRRTIGLREDELDLRRGHFGPTAWLGHSGQWLGAVGRDRPSQIFVLAQVQKLWRVVDVRSPGDPLPDAQDTELHLRYYRRARGRSTAVCLVLEAAQEQAAD